MHIVTNSVPYLDNKKLEYNSSDPIFSASFPSALINSASKDLKLDKFAYLTGDIKVKVAVQAQAMITCAFYLCYMPLEDYLPIVSQTRSKHYTQITSLPGVMFNLTSANTAEITIPYASLFEKWPLYYGMDQSNSDVRDWAHVYLFALAPLRSAGSPDITINAWAWFDKDSLRVEGPTFKSIVDDISYPNSVKTTLENSIKIKRKRFLKYQINVSETKKVLPSASTGIKVMSNVLQPIIKATPKWVSDTLAGSASMFGFSTPVSTDPINSFANIPAKSFTNVTKVDNSVVLGGSADNATDPRCAQYNDKDEMSIDYLCNIPAVIDLTSWKATSNLSLKYPLNFRGRVKNVFDGTAMVCTPGEFAMMNFRKNRGTIVFIFDFVKTAFHTGRIEIAYAPDDFDGTIAPDETDNCFRQIVDLQETSRVEFEIPFLNYSLFLQSTVDKSNFGHIWVRNLTNLAYTESTVSDTVDIIVSKYIKDPCVAQPNPCVAKIVLPPQPQTLIFQMAFPDIGQTISYWRSDQDAVVKDQPYFTSLEIPAGVAINVYTQHAFTTPTKPNAPAAGQVVGLFFYNSDNDAGYAKGGAYTTYRSGYKDFTYYLQPTEKEIDFTYGYTWKVEEVAYAQFWVEEMMMSVRFTDGHNQINLGVETENKKMSVFPGGDSAHKNLEALQAACGENIVSLRSLVHRSTISQPSVKFTAGESIMLTDPRIDRSDISTVAAISSCYRAVSGGINYKIILRDATSGIFTSQLVYKQSTVASQSALRHVTVNSLNPIHEISVPYFCRYRRFPVGFVATSSSAISPDLPDVYVTATEQCNGDVYVNGKDDFDCQMFIGAPLFNTND